MNEHTPSDGTVGKALSLLDKVAAYERPVRFSELLAESDLPKATLYRLLQTLVSQRMLTSDARSQGYALGPRLIRLAHAAWRRASLAPVARSHLDALSALSGETIHLAQLDNAQVLYVDKRNATRPIPMFSDAGKIGPAYCTGIGKAILAFLDDDSRERAIAQQSFYRHTPQSLTDAVSLRRELEAVRLSGFAYDREEHESQIICIATPILDARGRPLGGVSITSSTTRTSLDALGGFRDNLRATAAAIARDYAVFSLLDVGNEEGEIT
ncbi:MAG: IclR family transcriptional regulator [Salinarimonas sp.]|nr:IclR family transcriptional regulator [Salinarimonas sp.]